MLRDLEGLRGRGWNFEGLVLGESVVPKPPPPVHTQKTPEENTKVAQAKFDEAFANMEHLCNKLEALENEKEKLQQHIERKGRAYTGV